MQNSGIIVSSNHKRTDRFIAVIVALMVLLMMVSPLRAADGKAPENMSLTMETKELTLDEIPDNDIVELKVTVNDLPAFRSMGILIENDPELSFCTSIADPCPELSRAGGMSFSLLGGKYADIVQGKIPNVIQCNIAVIEDEMLKIPDGEEIITVYVILPDNVQPGDFYHVKIIRTFDGTYHDTTFLRTDDTKYDEDCFSELVSGGIRIVSSHDEPTDKPTSTSTSTPTSTPTSAPTSNPTKGGGFEDFVERLYTVALNRPSEPEGKAFWCEHVGNGDLNGAQCANEFLLSKEFNDRKLNDEDFLKVLYKTFFDRDAAKDPDGFSFWMNSLKTEGRDKVVDGFINSTEWCNICASYGVKSGATRAKATIASKNAAAFATRLYTECLGRDPEEGGLKFWSLGLTNLELTGSQAAREFFFCSEFNDHNFNNETLIKRMYLTFMGRPADESGLNFWLDSMKNGMTKEQVFDEFVKSKEFTEICKSYAIDRE